MWCYQRPGFEALLLAELQKQQQCSQFCDTLLKAEGVSVPVHSCVLSAVSPQISSALSSVPPPPAGQRRLLEFGTLGAGSLLHVVRLLYSGEMAGECDLEKREAVAAAAKLGIQGLVEVTDGDPKSRNEGRGGQRAEVGVQTEPHRPGESGTRRGVWRRQEKDGSTVLWREVPSDEDMCSQTTQTEQLDVDTAHPAASLKTIDASALHSLGQTDSHFVHSHVPYVPISLLYQSDGNEATHPGSTQDSTSAGHTSVAIVAPSFSSVPPSVNLLAACPADPQSRWTGPPGPNGDVLASEGWEDERLEQFQDNIPGFINYFLNPDREEGSRCRRAGRRQRARARGARSTAASEARPESRARGRRRGRLTEVVDVQDVGVSKLQKLFLQRGGAAAPSRPGQGGGTVGRKLYLRTREVLKRARRRQRYSAETDFMQSGGTLTFSKRGRGGRTAEQQRRQDIPPAGRARRARATPAASSPSSLSVPCRTVSASRPSLQVSPNLLSPPPAYTSPAAHLLHTSCLPPLPPAPPAQEEQPEHIDRLLEEVMIGLDILSNSGAPRAEPADPNSVRPSSKQTPSTDLESCPAVQGSSLVGAVGASSEVQQGDGELTDILDHFLQSFEQHIHNCGARETKEAGGSQPESGRHGDSTTAAQAFTAHTPPLKNTCRRQTARCSQTTALQQNVGAGERSRLPWTHRAPAPRGVAAEQAGGPSGRARLPSRQQRKSGTSQDVFPSEKRKRSSESLMPRRCPEQDKQLQQRPVVRLERSDALKAKLQGRCASPDVQNPAKTATGGKFYPIRSRLKETHLVEPSLPKPVDQGSRFKSNGPSTSPDDEGPAPHIQPAEPRRAEDQPEKRREGQGEAPAARPQAEARGPPSRRQKAQKRRGESAEGGSHDASVVKKVCGEQTAQPTTETPADCASEAAHGEDVIDVETVSVSSAGGDKNTLWSEMLFRETKDGLVKEEMQRDSDEIITVDGESDDATDLEKNRDVCKDWTEKAAAPPALVSPPSRSVKRDSLGSTGSSEDEDVDVTGGSSPVPGRVHVSWTESSEHEEEDEDVDVV